MKDFCDAADDDALQFFGRAARMSISFHKKFAQALLNISPRDFSSSLAYFMSLDLRSIAFSPIECSVKPSEAALRLDKFLCVLTGTTSGGAMAIRDDQKAMNYCNNMVSRFW
jgi:hypothetical protein